MREPETSSYPVADAKRMFMKSVAHFLLFSSLHVEMRADASDQFFYLSFPARLSSSIRLMKTQTKNTLASLHPALPFPKYYDAYVKL